MYPRWLLNNALDFLCHMQSTGQEKRSGSILFCFWKGLYSCRCSRKRKYLRTSRGGRIHKGKVCRQRWINKVTVGRNSRAAYIYIKYIYTASSSPCWIGCSRSQTSRTYTAKMRQIHTIYRWPAHSIDISPFLFPFLPMPTTNNRIKESGRTSRNIGRRVGLALATRMYRCT